MNEFSHLDDNNQPQMVDVGHKTTQKRTAIAVGNIKLLPETVSKIEQNEIRKGNVLMVAELAGIQAAKKKADLIPLCHPLPLTYVEVKAKIIDDSTIEIKAKASCIGLTGVEMEALTAVATALLTIYDMCKAVDKKMVMGDIHLLEKTKENL